MKKTKITFELSEPIIKSFVEFCNINNLGGSYMIEQFMIDKCKFYDTEFDKCRSSVKYFIENYCKIKTIKGLEHFTLHPFQEKVLEDFDNNKISITYQPRQMGMTTMGYLYTMWFTIFNDNTNAHIIPHTNSMSKHIMDSVRDTFNNLPMWMRTRVGIDVPGESIIKFNNGSKILFKNNDTYKIDLCIVDNVSQIDNMDIIMNQVERDMNPDGTLIMYGQRCSFLSRFIQFNGNLNINYLKYSDYPGRNNKWRLDMERLLGLDEFTKQCII